MIITFGVVGVGLYGALGSHCTEGSATPVVGLVPVGSGTAMYIRLATMSLRSTIAFPAFQLIHSQRFHISCEIFTGWPPLNPKIPARHAVTIHSSPTS